MLEHSSLRLAVLTCRPMYVKNTRHDAQAETKTTPNVKSSGFGCCV